MISSIASAFAGKWTEAFKRLEVKYNKRSWWFVAENHSPEDSLFSLMDRSDGSSFLLRVELLSESLDEEGVVDVESLEKWGVENAEGIAESLLEPVFEKGLVEEHLGRRSLLISDREFQSFGYVIGNPKFGKQFLEQAHLIEKGVIVMIQFSWPHSEVSWPSAFPIKLQALLEGLRVKLEG